MRISDWSSDVCSADLFANLFVEPRRMARRLDYQEALRRPGTSPRMVASRSLLRPTPNLAYTARGRPVRAQRRVWREGEESRAEERRVGQERVLTFSFRGAPYTEKKKTSGRTHK